MTHLWERLAPVDEDMTEAEVNISKVDSFLEAARATGANEAAMVWQVVRHADREADTVKELILSAVSQPTPTMPGSCSMQCGGALSI